MRRFTKLTAALFSALLMTACGTPSPSYTVTTRNEQGNILTQETYTGDTLTMRLTMTYITVPAFK